MAFAEPREVIGAFLGEPSFAITQQFLTKNNIELAIRFRDRIMTALVFGLDCTRSKFGKHFPRRPQG